METENRRKAIANKYSAVPTPTPTTNILKSLTALDKIKRKNKNKKSRCRPAWSHAESSATLTNEEGINKSINNNETEICSDDISLGDEDLLEFAANLNFETDTQDIELRNLINILESRIGTLEKEVEKEKLISDRLPENRICNSMVSEQERELIVSNNSNDKKSQEDNEVEDEDKVLLRAARNLLTNRYFKFHQSSETGSRSGDENVDEDDEHALQFVHSQRSLVAVLKALKHSFQAESVEMRKT